MHIISYVPLTIAILAELDPGEVFLTYADGPQTITTPNFPDNYTDGLKDSYKFYLDPNSCPTFLISFGNSFDVVDTPVNCARDRFKLDINDGSDPLHLCGTDVPDDIEIDVASYPNMPYIIQWKFVDKDGATGTGFQATVECPEPFMTTTEEEETTTEEPTTTTQATTTEAATTMEPVACPSVKRRR